MFTRNTEYIIGVRGTATFKIENRLSHTCSFELVYPFRDVTFEVEVYGVQDL